MDAYRGSAPTGHDSVQKVQPKAARRHCDQNRLCQNFVTSLLQVVFDVSKQQPLACQGSSTYAYSGPGDKATPFLHNAAMRARRRFTVNSDFPTCLCSSALFPEPGP